MRLNSIIPALGMVVCSVSAVLAGNGNLAAAPNTSWTQFATPGGAIAAMERSLGRAGEELTPTGVTATVTNSPARWES